MLFGETCKLLKIWSGRRGSNPRRPAWEAALPTEQLQSLTPNADPAEGGWNPPAPNESHSFGSADASNAPVVDPLRARYAGVGNLRDTRGSQAKTVSRHRPRGAEAFTQILDTTRPDSASASMLAPEFRATRRVTVGFRLSAFLGQGHPSLTAPRNAASIPLQPPNQNSLRGSQAQPSRITGTGLGILPGLMLFALSPQDATGPRGLPHSIGDQAGHLRPALPSYTFSGTTYGFR